MSQYHAPLKEMHFVLNELAGLDQVGTLPGFEDATPDTVAAILDEAAKFATEVLDPLNAVGDREGAHRLEDGSVRTPAGFKAAYLQYCANGWNGLTKNPEFGGQGLPQLVATAVEEMCTQRTWPSICARCSRRARSRRSSSAAPRSRRSASCRRWSRARGRA